MSEARSPAVRESLRIAAVPWVAARVLVATGWVIAANLVGSRFVEGRPEQLRQGLFMWDGSWYRDLATFGYHSAPREAFRFFPLLPWLGRVMGALPLVPTSWVVVGIANAGALAAGVLIHRLTWLETGDARTAQRAVWMLALFPGAFTMAFAYAEGLFVALALGVFLALRRGRFGVAAALGLLAALCRPTGVLLVFPAAVEVARSWKSKSWKPSRQRVAGLAAVLAPAVGGALVLLHSSLVGTAWDDPVQAQRELRHATVFPLVRIARALADLFGPERSGDGLHAFAAVGLVVALVLCARWLPASSTAYVGAATLLFLSADNLNSLERYALNTVPVVIVAALLGRRRWVEWSMFAVMGGAFIGLTTASLLGAYVP
jgi:hypothetical protein